jgi:hypothetical protein
MIGRNWMEPIMPSLFRRLAMAAAKARQSRRAVRIAFGLALSFTIVMAFWPGLKGLPATDTEQHAAAFSVLTMLGMRLVPSLPQLALATILSLFGGLIEIVQELPILHRTADFGDWTVDVVAVAAVLAGVALLRAVGALIRARAGSRPLAQ